MKFRSQVPKKLNDGHTPPCFSNSSNIFILPSFGPLYHCFLTSSVNFTRHNLLPFPKTCVFVLEFRKLGRFSWLPDLLPLHYCCSDSDVFVFLTLPTLFTPPFSKQGKVESPQRFNYSRNRFAYLKESVIIQWDSLYASLPTNTLYN